MDADSFMSVESSGDMESSVIVDGGSSSVIVPAAIVPSDEEYK